MSQASVFDTEAIIAVRYDDPGHERVAALLDELADDDSDGRLADLTATEVYSLVARFEGTDDRPTGESFRIADRDVRTLERRGLALEQAGWRRTAEIKADGQISLADAAAVAVAHEYDATLVIGGGDDVDSVPVDVPIERVRAHGV